MVSFELLEVEKYYNSLLKEIPRAKKRITIAAMVVLWGERTAPVFLLLKEALARGVEVTILFDRYTRLTYLYGLSGKTATERVKQTYRMLEDLSAEGAKIYGFGKLGIVPYKGRCHVKATIIDDRVYSFGGVNFFDEMFEATDIMLTGNDAKTADRLARLIEQIGTNRPPLADDEVKIDRNCTMLFDGGQPDRSIIYERACELTAQAKRVVVVSQMVPSGQLARLLAETDAAVYSNRPEQMRPIDSLGQAFDQQKYRIKNLYTGDKYIHAKVMLFELTSGKKVVLSGSHNFSWRGVQFGTQEIALESRDEALWEQLHKFIQKKIVKAE
ncbi:hypothetical protein IRY61_00260 [Candidatus Saccharibacteria bacterium]|nr:hypothetical protein [Candidatus Saccharibacteria bacterium]